MKWLLLLLVAVAVIHWLGRAKKAAVGAAGGRRPAPQVESMLQCAQCGVHFPASEAVTVGDRVYCSDAHSRLHAPR
ncbi:hypothetical protein E4K72_05815 [Oxalobacteraceae bacterium OM1]|nr:hypothetical protein E4K72_05815 [Oxalobacteraceae bacterium OM1]